MESLEVFVAGSSRELDRVDDVIQSINECGGLVVPFEKQWTRLVREHNSGERTYRNSQSALFCMMGMHRAKIFVGVIPTTPTTGFWVELGMAVSQDKKIFLLGPIPEELDNAIYLSLGHTIADSLEELLDLLRIYKFARLPYH